MAHGFSLWRAFGIERHHQLLLKWMVLAAVAVFAFFVAARFGLVEQVFAVDRTYISLAITLLFVITSAHCAVRVLHISGELGRTGDGARRLAGAPGALALDGDAVRSGGEALPDGLLAGHVRDLMVKASLKPGRVDQTLLLKAFEEKLFNAQAIGFFVAETMLRLGLLGTVIGFIFMLAPLAGVQAIDVGQMREILASMSDGMAVALYTTLCGLIGGILLKLEYYFLQGGTEELVAMVTEVTEVYVIPALENGAAEGAGAAH